MKRFYLWITALSAAIVLSIAVMAAKPINTFDQVGMAGLACDDDYSLPLGQFVNAGSGLIFFSNDDVDVNEEDLSEFCADTAQLEMVLPLSASTIWMASSDNTATSLVAIQGADSSGNLQEEEKAVTGQTPVTLANTYLRIWRARIVDDNGLTGATAIYLARNAAFTGGVPDDNNNVMAYVTNGIHETQQSGFYIPNGNVGLVKSININVGDSLGASNTVMVKFQVRPPGGVWLTLSEMALDRGTSNILFPEPIKIDSQSDIRLRGQALSVNGRVSGSYAVRLLPDTLCDTVGISF